MGRYRIRLSEKDLKTHATLLKKLMKQAYDEAGG